MTTKFIPIHISYLIPDQSVPCSIFFHQHGEYLEQIPKDTPVMIDLLAKLKMEEIYFGYIKREKLRDWEEWIEERYIYSKDETGIDRLSTEFHIRIGKFINKPIEMISFKDVEKYEDVLEEAKKLYPRCVKNPAIRAFFEVNKDLEIFAENSFVAFISTLFLLVSGKDYFRMEEISDIISAAILHKLPSEKRSKEIPSSNALKFLRVKKITLPRSVLQIITFQDELCDGSGFPAGLTKEELPLTIRTFSIIKHFYHEYSKLQVGTRREKIEQAAGIMDKHKSAYDDKMLPLFLEFLKLLDLRV